MDTAGEHPPIIEMHGVAVGALRDFQAVVLEGLSWKVHAGDFWVIAGMHNTGKSDLLAMTAGLMPPQGGTYHLFGNEMPIFEGHLLAERLRLGLVFDGGRLFHDLTVRQNIALPLQYHEKFPPAESARRVDAALQLMELTDWTESTPGNLGRNLQKRVGLARALVLQPEVLLLDNPLGGLDFRQSAWWLNLMDQLWKGHPFLEGRRVTLVATAEDLRPWRRHATHFALLQNKRFTFLGRESELSGNTDVLVKELLAEPPPGS